MTVSLQTQSLVCDAIIKYDRKRVFLMFAEYNHYLLLHILHMTKKLVLSHNLWCHCS